MRVLRQRGRSQTKVQPISAVPAVVALLMVIQ